MRLAWTAVLLAPLPLAVALIFTAKPVYHPDACFYGSSAADREWTDDYLRLMAPLGMFGWAAASTVVAWSRRWHWRAVAGVVFAWAALTLVWREAAHPLMYPGGLVALFGIFLTPPVLVVVAVAARQTTWLRALAWFEVLYLLPVLLGLAKVLAQPPCIP